MKQLTYVIFGIMMFTLPAQAVDLENGKALFDKKCKGCHRLGEGVKMGPSLLGVTKRRSEEWLHRWLQGPKEMIKSGDPIAVELHDKFKKTMPTRKEMQEKKNRDDVIGFLKKNDKENVN